MYSYRYKYDLRLVILLVVQGHQYATLFGSLDGEGNQASTIAVNVASLNRSHRHKPQATSQQAGSAVYKYEMGGKPNVTLRE